MFPQCLLKLCKKNHNLHRYQLQTVNSLRQKMFVLSVGYIISSLIFKRMVNRKKKSYHKKSMNEDPRRVEFLSVKILENNISIGKVSFRYIGPMKTTPYTETRTRFISVISWDSRTSNVLELESLVCRKNYRVLLLLLRC